MRIGSKWLLLCLTLLFCGQTLGESAPPADTSDGLAAALAAYGQAQAASNKRSQRSFKLERFNRAAILFENAAQQYHSNPDIWANAGTAYLQAEQLGRAIIAFKRALAIDPDHARSLQNLAHSRSQLPAWVPRAEDDNLAGTFFFWRQMLSAPEQHMLAAIIFAIAGIVLGLGIARKSSALRLVGAGLAAIWLILLIPLLVAQPNEPDAVLVQDITALRAADSQYAPARLAQSLPPGTEVSIVERRESWSRVRLADGETGWVPSGSAVLVDSVINPGNGH